MRRCCDCRAGLLSGSICPDCAIARVYGGQRRVERMGRLHPDELRRRERVAEMKLDPLEGREAA